MGKVITILIAALATTAFAEQTDQISQQEDGQWVRDWWSNEYEPKIKQSQEQQVSGSSCEYRLERYRQKYEDDPTEYNQWKYESWKQQCEEELNTANPRNIGVK